MKIFFSSCSNQAEVKPYLDRSISQYTYRTNLACVDLRLGLSVFRNPIIFSVCWTTICSMNCSQDRLLLKVKHFFLELKNNRNWLERCHLSWNGRFSWSMSPTGTIQMPHFWATSQLPLLYHKSKTHRTDFSQLIYEDITFMWPSNTNNDKVYSTWGRIFNFKNQSVYKESDWFSYSMSEEQQSYLQHPYKGTTGDHTMRGRLVCNTG